MNRIFDWIRDLLIGDCESKGPSTLLQSLTKRLGEPRLMSKVWAEIVVQPFIVNAISSIGSILFLTGGVLLVFGMSVGFKYQNCTAGMGFYVNSDFINCDGALAYYFANINANLAVALLSAGFTMVISDVAQRKNLMADLILQMASPDNLLAIEAARRLENYGWLRNGSLYRADLSGADLTQADLIGAKLNGTELSSTKLVRAELWGAQLKHAGGWNTKLIKANLREANLTRVELRQAKLQGADLRGTDLTWAILDCCDLTGADLRFANLSDAKLYTERTSSLQLTSEILWIKTSPDDLDFTNLRDANLKGAKYTLKTSWPPNIDPRAAGAILVED